jgi:hypothetical protein
MVYDAGVKLVCGLTNSVLSTIQATVDKIVDAFQAFVTWAVEFIESVVNELFAPIVNGIQQMGESYSNKVAAACSSLISDIQSIGSISEESLAALVKAILGDLFIMVAGITMIVVLALTTLSVVTGPFGFLMSFVTSIVVSLIVETALQAALATVDFMVDAGETMRQVIAGLLEWSGGSIDGNDVLSTMIDALIFMFELYGAAFVAACPGLTKEEKKIGRDLAFAVIGILLAGYSVGMVNEDVAHAVDVVALMMAGGALLLSAIDLIDALKKPNSSPKIILGICSLISLAGCAKSAWDVKEDYYGQ